MATSHQDVALFTRSFADLGSESSSARKVPRSRMDTSTVTPSGSDSAVRARLRYSGPCHQNYMYSQYRLHLIVMKVILGAQTG